MQIATPVAPLCEPETMLDPRRVLSYSWAYRKWRELVTTGDSYKRFAREFLRITPGQRVLDIGCGPADILDVLPDGIDYHGFDFEPKYIETARARYGKRGTFAVRAVTPDAVDDIGTFDVIMALGVLHHLTDEEVETLFAGAARILKPGGRLVTHDGVYVDDQSATVKVLLWLDRGRYVRRLNGYTDLAKRHFKTVKTHILHDLIALPYTHLVMELSDPHAAEPAKKAGAA